MLALFNLGLVLGGLLSASVLWLVSGLTDPVPETGRIGVALVAAGAGLLRDFGVVTLPLPQHARQIPQEVLLRKPLRGALQFGFELGTGVRTYISSTSPYVLAIALFFISPGFVPVALAGLGFGIGRGATAAAQYWSRDPEWNKRAAARIGPLTRSASGVMLGFLVLVAING
ncbi:hypothetical protein SMC26_40755 [Actinomadura fulvescens]|uniref:Uncharacterized protein n=1 Tax=Actinomadura fulvescens TaxID=46160 RepID=A0ABP6D9C3_9ACTN